MKTLDMVLETYFEHFGENYPLCVTSGRSEEEIIADIERCIDTDTAKEPPEYDDACDY